MKENIAVVRSKEGEAIDHVKLRLHTMKTYYIHISRESKAKLSGKRFLYAMEWGEHESLYKAEYVRSIIVQLEDMKFKTLEDLREYVNRLVLELAEYTPSNNEASNRCNVLKIQALALFNRRIALPYTVK